jgi:hypothetical protein
MTGRGVNQESTSGRIMTSASWERARTQWTDHDTNEPAKEGQPGTDHVRDEGATGDGS